MKQVGKGRISASSLEFPFGLYPRNHKNEKHVDQLAAALSLGETLPPIAVEEGSLRVVDGWHRVSAYQKVFGHDCEIEAEFWTYKDDQYFFLHATRLNATHGLKLNAGDQQRCLVVAKNLNIHSDRIHRVLALTPEEAKSIMEDRADTRTQSAVPLKNGLQYLRRRTLDKTQAEATRKLSGKPPSYHADQLIAMMENGLMPEITTELAEKLSHLKELLEERGY